LEISEKQG